VRWYRINDAGREEEYFSMLLEDVRITGINPVMPNIKTTGESQINHIESISLLYERITWHYKDGNIRFTDSWLDR
jgi:type VI secretion system secreted protein Hcp